jgi:hypothetical protein
VIMDGVYNHVSDPRGSKHFSSIWVFFNKIEELGTIKYSFHSMYYIWFVLVWCFCTIYSDWSWLLVNKLNDWSEMLINTILNRFLHEPKDRVYSWGPVSSHNYCLMIESFF